MQKAYNRIKWENYPSDETPLNETNLNKVDAAVDELDNRVIMHETTKATKTEVASLVQDVAFEESTGIFTIKKKNGAVLKIDTKLEKIAVNFAYNSTTQQIILTLIDGTKQYIDLSALITQYEFVDTATIGFEITSDGKVKATVLDGSITEDKLQPNYLADIKVEVAKAQSSATAAGKSEANAAASADTATTKATAAANSASAAKTSETNAKTSETNAGNSAQKAESYAVGGTGTRTGEDADNAKYYSQNASGSAETAKRSANTATARATDAANSATAAKTSETNAKTSETNAGNSASVASAKSTAAATSATNASASEKNASASANTASSKADAAATSATNAANSASSASSSASSASTSKTSAANSAAAAASSAASAAKSATQADNYANGSTNSAKYYYEQAKSISESISGTLKPMGTVTFANLPVLSSSATGDMYNISNEFTTTSDFKEGAGNVIPAGANIYKTSDGKWDVLAGSPVTGVKGNAESSYRRGNVNITLPSLGVSATDAELNCMSGVTGNVQAQLDNKAVLGNNAYFESINLSAYNAIPYIYTENDGIYFRYVDKYSGEIAHTNICDIVRSFANYLPLTGESVLNGRIAVNCNVLPGSEAYHGGAFESRCTNPAGGYRAGYGFHNVGLDAAYLYYDENGWLRLVNNGGDTYTIPHTAQIDIIDWSVDGYPHIRLTNGLWYRLLKLGDCPMFGDSAYFVGVNLGTSYNAIPYIYSENNDVNFRYVDQVSGETKYTSISNILRNFLNYLPLTGGTVSGNIVAENIVATADTESRIGQYTIRSNTIQNTTTGAHLMARDDSHAVYTHGAYLGVCKTDGSWTYVCASAFSNQSSRRYKDNIEDMTDEEALKVLQLRPVKYDYIRREDGTDCYGVIAEEADEIMHYPVIYDSEGRPDGVDYSRFVPYLIKTVQIQQQEIDALREELACIRKIMAGTVTA